MGTNGSEYARQLLWRVDDAEFDEDVRAAELAMFSGDGPKCERWFKTELVKMRRVRQLVDVRQAARTGPSFRGDTPEEEKETVRRVNFPEWLRRGWDLAGAVEKLWKGEMRFCELLKASTPIPLE